MDLRNSSSVYLVDMHCYRPPDELRMNTDDALDIWRKHKVHSPLLSHFHDGGIWFHEHRRLSTKHTYLMKYLNPEYCGSDCKTGLEEAMEEARMCLFGSVDGLLKQTGIQPTDVDILITCCSIFCPTPSMSAVIVNHFKMRSDIQSYHLGGMGCSMGVVSINLVRDLLKAHPNSIAMLCTTETTTPAYYTGTERSRVVTNLLFRMGGAAMLFTNKPSRKLRPKYQLQTCIRVHQGVRDPAYNCIRYSPDAEGINGISLGKNVVEEASKGLEKVITKIAPKVLDVGQITRFVLTELARRFNKGIKRFAPNFDKCIDHVLIHAGGAKVLEGLGQHLKLSPYTLKPSYDVLYYYGNVSSSTTWYTLSNIESLRGVRKGDKIMQVGVGSGLKCGVNLWVACRDIWEVHDSWKHVVEERGIQLPRRQSTMTWIFRDLLKLMLMILLLFVVCAFLKQTANPLMSAILDGGLYKKVEL